MKIIILTAIGYFASFINFMIIARVIMSWIRLSDNILFRFVYAVTEPLLGPVRRIVDKSPLGSPGMPLDFSPAIVMLLVVALQSVAEVIIMAI